MVSSSEGEVVVQRLANGDNGGVGLSVVPNVALAQSQGL